MARSRGGARSRPAPAQTRSASTMAAHPPARQQQQASQTSAYSQPQTGAQPRQPGLFAQMASTAAGVAVGSAVGHTLGAGLTGMFSGSSSAPAEQQQQQMAAAPAQQQGFAQEQARACDVDARSFTRCLEENSGNMQICDFYLQQLKACQEAARQY
ncbi:LANO_0A06392g1_1 [Lachancea nothofagi CBS 11611]|uniref:LANO_0A06392g1_1 n=1 Tax=Lachancea nothofagi CBS 11611 TaxID=1266666 RepID=A0A1G4IRS6_9SACH|nr:LANO_0A06392g1_1 [Lachancea nothofagi CBS 11611]